MFDAPGAGAPPRRPASSGPAALASHQISNGNAHFLLETIVCDVHATTMQIATLAMMLSHSRAGGKSALRSGRHLIHDDSKTMLLALRFAADIGLPADIVARVTRTYREVGEAKRRLAPLLEATGDRQAPQSLLQGHCDAWRRIAAEASSMIAELHQATGSRLNPTYAADSGELRKFLDQASRGATDAIDAAGVITTPKLQQRRQAPRLNIDRGCTVLLPTGPAPARLEDVSQRGLGIVCDVPMTDQQKVTVVLDDGRRLEALVVRRRGANIGLQLRVPLSNSDPLFEPGRAVERK